MAFSLLIAWLPDNPITTIIVNRACFPRVIKKVFNGGGVGVEAVVVMELRREPLHLPPDVFDTFIGVRHKEEREKLKVAAHFWWCIKSLSPNRHSR